MRVSKCPVCNGPTRVHPFRLGGHGPADCVICEVGMADMSGDHPGIIERLPDNWQLIEAAEDEAFRALNRVPVNAADWSRALKVKAGIAAVVAVILVLVR